MKPPAPVTRMRLLCLSLILSSVGTLGYRLISRPCQLTRSTASKNGRERAEEDQQIQRKRPAVDVVQVEANPIGKHQGAATAHLPQAGETWQDTEAAHIRRRRETHHVA